eukprot:SAG31_NODE_15548_length_749_cov_1.187692_2_plen_69_part_00
MKTQRDQLNLYQISLIYEKHKSDISKISTAVSKYWYMNLLLWAEPGVGTTKFNLLASSMYDTHVVAAL